MTTAVPSTITLAPGPSHTHSSIAESLANATSGQLQPSAGFATLVSLYKWLQACFHEPNEPFCESSFKSHKLYCKALHTMYICVLCNTKVNLPRCNGQQVICCNHCTHCYPLKVVQNVEASSSVADHAISTVRWPMLSGDKCDQSGEPGVRLDIHARNSQIHLPTWVQQPPASPWSL